MQESRVQGGIFCAEMRMVEYHSVGRRYIMPTISLVHFLITVNCIYAMSYCHSDVFVSLSRLLYSAKYERRISIFPHELVQGVESRCYHVGLIVHTFRIVYVDLRSEEGHKVQRESEVAITEHEYSARFVHRSYIHGVDEVTEAIIQEKG